MDFAEVFAYQEICLYFYNFYIGRGKLLYEYFENIELLCSQSIQNSYLSVVERTYLNEGDTINYSSVSIILKIYIHNIIFLFFWWFIIV